MNFADSPFDIKTLDDTGRIEGILAGFGNIDRGNDMLLAGCFAKSLAARKTPIPMLLQHDHNRPIGAWRTWQEGAEGLFVQGEIALRTRDGQEAYELAKAGALTGLSIGWRSKLAKTEVVSGVNVIAEADLYEGSLVTVPMNPVTVVTSVKSICNAADIAEVLRECGFSNRRAKLAAGAAWKAINGAEDDDRAHTEIENLFKEHTARLAATGGM